MTISTRLPLTAGLLAAVGFAVPGTPQEPAPPPRCAYLVPAETERAPLDETLQASVGEALQDEYHGEALYSRVLKELGDLRPFASVVHAEERHAALLEELLESRDLTVPANRWADADVPTWASRREACSAAADFEKANAALYDRLLAGDDLPEDVRLVFEHNRMASRDRHLPAFERCASGRGAAAASVRGGGRGSGRRSEARGGCGHCRWGRHGRAEHGCRGHVRGRRGDGCGRAVGWRVTSPWGGRRQGRAGAPPRGPGPAGGEARPPGRPVTPRTGARVSGS